MKGDEEFGAPVRRGRLGIAYRLLFRRNSMPRAGAITFLLAAIEENRVLVYPTLPMDEEGAGADAAVMQGRVYNAIREYFVLHGVDEDKRHAVSAMSHIEFYLLPQQCDVRLDGGNGLILHMPEDEWPPLDRIRAAMRAAGLAAITFLMAAAASACAGFP